MKNDVQQKHLLLMNRLSAAIQAELVEAKLHGINVCIEEISSYESLMPALTKTEKDCDIQVEVVAHIYVSGFEDVLITDIMVNKLAEETVETIQSLIDDSKSATEEE